MKRIIYKNIDNSIAIIIPTSDALAFLSIEDIANKDVPAGKEYFIVDEFQVPSDRTFREAWEFSDKVDINSVKATDIAKNKIRAWRKKQFEENDVILQNSIVDGDEVKKSEAVNRRNYLRDLPEQCDGKTVEELKVILQEYI